VDPSKRIVTGLPLRALWDSAGRDVPATRGRLLGREAIGGLLRAGTVSFVVADVGQPLRWIAPGERYAFWKRELQPHLCEGEIGTREDYPGEYFYFATEWRLHTGDPVVVLEKEH